MIRTITAILVCLLLNIRTFAQMDTPTPSDSPYLFATMTTGQATRFDYVTTAGAVHITNQLVFLFLSLWVMFLFFVFVMRREQK